MTLNQRRRFLVASGGVLVASRMYVLTSVLLSCYERVFSTKKKCIFHDFGIGPTGPSDYRTFSFILDNLFFLTYEPSD